MQYTCRLIFSTCYNQRTTVAGLSGRFVKQEQWERWRADWNWCMGPSTESASARVRGY